MHFPTLLSVALATAGADAFLTRIGLPKTIKAGETFAAQVEVLSQQATYQQSIMFGYTPEDVYTPSMGSLGIYTMNPGLIDLTSECLPYPAYL